MIKTAWRMTYSKAYWEMTTTAFTYLWITTSAIFAVHSWLGQVVGDDAVQRSGGDALWNTVQYALSTRVMKAVGLTLLVATSVVLSGLAGGGTGYSGGWGRGAWGGGGEGRGEGN